MNLFNLVTEERFREESFYGALASMIAPFLIFHANFKNLQRLSANDLRRLALAGSWAHPVLDDR